METIRITSYGHACFGVSFGNASVILDPYAPGSVPGLKLPDDLMADRVYCSHQHSDHNARECVTETAPASDPFSASFLCVPHDDANGTKRGWTDITFLHAGGCVIAHLGDIGRIPTGQEYEELKKADVLMIPAGGYYTIDAVQAKQIIEEVKPKLVIIMHYRRGSSGYDVLASMDEIRKVLPGLVIRDGSAIEFTAESIPDEIIALTPAR